MGKIKAPSYSMQKIYNCSNIIIRCNDLFLTGIDRKHDGKCVFVGGKCEVNDKFIDTAIRELKEEVLDKYGKGLVVTKEDLLKLGKLIYGSTNDNFHPFESDIFLYDYKGENNDLTLNYTEFDSHKWLTKSEMQSGHLDDYYQALYNVAKKANPILN
jgi:8-oxo-dGTP pyrophosphatase MutT (NUDIX family)